MKPWAVRYCTTRISVVGVFVVEVLAAWDRESYRTHVTLMEINESSVFSHEC